MLGAKRLGGLDSTEDDVTKVILDCPKDPNARAKIMEEARSIWRQCYGVARTGSSQRLDKGCSKNNKRKSDAKISVGTKFARKHFTQARRRAAAALVQEVSSTEGLRKIDAVTHAEMPGWTGKHDREMHFQLDKRLHRHREAASRAQTVDGKFCQ